MRHRRQRATALFVTGAIALQVCLTLGCAAGWKGPTPPVRPSPGAESLGPDRSSLLPTERLWTYKHGTFLGAAPVAAGSYLVMVDHKGKVIFLDPNSGQLRARAKAKYPIHDAPVLDEERFYVVQAAPRRRLEAFGFADGKSLWRQDFTHPPKPPIKSGEELLVAVGDTVYALEAETGEILRVVAAGGGRWTEPVSCDSGFLLATKGGLLRSIAADGRIRWEKELEFPLAGPPVTAADGFLLAGSAGELVKLGPAGEEAWRDSLGSAPIYTPALLDGKVFVISASGAVTALESATGRRLWVQGLGAPGARGLYVQDTWLAVNSVDGILWLLDADSGEVRDTLQFGELVHEPPVWAFGRLYVVTENKKLHALGTGPKQP